MTRIQVSQHAVDRFVERVRPALDVGEARHELERLIDQCGQIGDRPDWQDHRADLCERWLWIGPDICLPVQRDLAITVLVRGLVPDQHRRNLNQAKQAARRAARSRRLRQRNQPGRPPRPAPDSQEGMAA
jgi:hypothetical protein